MDKNNKIMVYYIGVAGIRSEDYEDFVTTVSKRITPSNFDGEIIIIPRQSVDTEVVMLNPEYITDVELINRNTELMTKLRSHLENELNLLKNNKDGKTDE